MQPANVPHTANEDAPAGAASLTDPVTTATNQDSHAVPDGTPQPGSQLFALAESSQAPHAPMNRVIDVPLTVTLRFGQRQLTLRELLELNTGSLVELDQQVEEPVHLMLGERIIARGEVVIVDGNYGMRVLEVVEHPAAHRIAALDHA